MGNTVVGVYINAMKTTFLINVLIYKLFSTYKFTSINKEKLLIDSFSSFPCFYVIHVLFGSLVEIKYLNQKSS